MNTIKISGMEEYRAGSEQFRKLWCDKTVFEEDKNIVYIGKVVR